MASKRAQKRKVTRRRCQKKRCYRDLDQARHDAAYLSQRDGHPVDVYVDPSCACDGVFVGHRPTRGTPSLVVREGSAA